ncbi:hypothetical protein ACGFNU_33510 [Spirillospora sp. NPDC048911]|uniref:hypothetical protein n=1 Tax=Spirillospora sp. NPDC048911 TaxID=3364527 RepID=UPI00371C6B76
MRFGVLGSLEVWSADGGTVAAGGPRLRALLAMLLLNVGRTVDARLVEGLYGPEAPTGAAHALQSQVSRLRSRLIAGLADRRVLLVLDNCEHVVAEVAALTRRLLAACADLRILVTSRERLGITGETLHPVAPFGGSEAFGHPAVRLFADRAAAVRPGFQIDGANVGAVLRVCRALDGLPSAIELADLVDKSLVEAGGGRYRMLETVHEFCAERLADSGERERVRAAHAAFFLDLAQTAEPHLRGPDQLEWLARLDAERGNLHAALRWAAGAEPALGLCLLAALSWLGQLRGLPGERAVVAADLLTPMTAANAFAYYSCWKYGLASSS